MSPDVVVIGVGGMGSAACLHLARRGLRVLGLEQFQVAHDRGSSHGRTRIIRKAYFEHPDYVPLLERAYAGWDALAADARLSLFARCGLFLAGPSGGRLVRGVRLAAEVHRLPIESLDETAAAERFPALHTGPELAVLFERDAGYLRVEECVAAHAALARSCGAEIRTGAAVRGWTSDGRTVRVRLDGEVVESGALAICGGAWAGSLLADLGLPLTVRRKVQLWFEAAGDGLRAESGCPVFAFDTPDGFYYGFPRIDGEPRIKAAEHTGGEPVDCPDAVERSLRPGDSERVAAFVSRYLRGAAGRVVHHQVCLYTMTPDEHFIVDRHPSYANVALAAGFSGHGFKFCPVIGERLADLLTHAAPDPAGAFLGLDRPALRSAAARRPPD